MNVLEKEKLRMIKELKLVIIDIKKAGMAGSGKTINPLNDC